MAKKSGKSMAGRPRSRGPAPSHGHEEHVTFDLSPSTSKAVDGAVKGLNARQRDRVMDAIGTVADEVGAKVGRWVENKFVRNANELLLVLTPILVKGGLWGELRGIWAFLEELGVRIGHKKIVKALERDLGEHLASHYRDVLASTKETRVRPAGAKAPPAAAS